MVNSLAFDGKEWKEMFIRNENVDRIESKKEKNCDNFKADLEPSLKIRI